MSGKHVKNLMVPIPEPIHAEFKSQVARDRKNMGETIVRLIREYLKVKRAEVAVGDD